MSTKISLNSLIKGGNINTTDARNINDRKIKIIKRAIGRGILSVFFS